MLLGIFTQTWTYWCPGWSRKPPGTPSMTTLAKHSLLKAAMAPNAVVIAVRPQTHESVYGKLPSSWAAWLISCDAFSASEFDLGQCFLNSPKMTLYYVKGTFLLIIRPWDSHFLILSYLTACLPFCIHWALGKQYCSLSWLEGWGSMKA